MPLQPSNTGIIWDVDPSSTLETVEAGYKKDTGGNWYPSIVPPFQGAVYETAKDNGNYTLFDTSLGWRLIDNGFGGFTPSLTGTETAVLADDGSGGLYIAPIGTKTRAGRILQASDGTLYPVRDDTGELKLVRVGGHYMTYL